jgi:hypothetical protein
MGIHLFLCHGRRRVYHANGALFGLIPHQRKPEPRRNPDSVFFGIDISNVSRIIGLPVLEPGGIGAPPSPTAVGSLSSDNRGKNIPSEDNGIARLTVHHRTQNRAGRLPGRPRIKERPVCALIEQGHIKRAHQHATGRFRQRAKAQTKGGGLGVFLHSLTDRDHTLLLGKYLTDCFGVMP